MEFRLIYEGSLKASGNASKNPVKEKHKIRKHFHKQLSELWDVHPTLNGLKNRPRTPYDLFPTDDGSTHVEMLARQFSKCGYRFVPLVNKQFNLICSLNILFLRRENPGDLILRGGDIDNRIKTLLDALRMPEDCNEVDGAPDAAENPFFCLLQNDSLVTELNVTTDRLLTPLLIEQNPKDVSLVIQVKIKAAHVTVANLDFLT